MANSAQARKRARQALKNRAHNASLRTAFRTAVKKVLKSVEAGDKAAAQATFQQSTKVMDRIADKGVFHKNKAARHKSRLSAKVKAMAYAPHRFDTANLGGRFALILPGFAGLYFCLQNNKKIQN